MFGRVFFLASHCLANKQEAVKAHRVPQLSSQSYQSVSRNKPSGMNRHGSDKPRKVRLLAVQAHKAPEQQHTCKKERQKQPKNGQRDFGRTFW